jgi:hypothetical protein
MLDKLAPKISNYSLLHWDRFVGVCFVLVGLAGYAGLLEKLQHPVGFILLGVGMNAFAMMRRSIQFIGDVRRYRLATGHGWKKIYGETYPAFGAVAFWLLVIWVCCRYAFMNFQISEAWIKWVLRY